MNEKTFQRIKELTELQGTSGFEHEVRAYMRDAMTPLVDRVEQDGLGGIYGIREHENADAPRIMVAAHMDEVGFMIVNDEGDGIFEFRVIGGVDPRQLVGKPVSIGRGHVPGVIGAKAIHLTTPEERQQVLKVDQLRIDIGTGSGGKVKVGDRGTFATKLVVLGPSIRSKALDDRLGVFNLIQLVKYAPDNVDLLAAFTVQEELGLRGAKIAAFSFDPEIGIAMDSTPANDLPDYDGNENTSHNTKLGDGPAIYIMDRGTIGDQRLIKWLIESAEAEKIPWQFRQPGLGGTDAGEIHKTRTGVPSVSVSVPQRYLHSPAGLIRIEDELNTLKLIHTALTRLDRSILNLQEKK